jgi:hypothetical protein
MRQSCQVVSCAQLQACNCMISTGQGPCTPYTPGVGDAVSDQTTVNAYLLVAQSGQQSAAQQLITFYAMASKSPCLRTVGKVKLYSCHFLLQTHMAHEAAPPAALPGMLPQPSRQTNPHGSRGCATCYLAWLVAPAQQPSKLMWLTQRRHLLPCLACCHGPTAK